MNTAATSPTRRSHSGWRVIRNLVLGFFLLLVIVAAGAVWIASTATFQNRMRGEVIDVLESATGGRVELAGFSWHLSKLEIEADNLTIHGLEGPGEVPYAHVDKLLIRAKIISLFHADVGLRLLQAEHPVVHLIVYPDGTTNQPTPKTKTQSTSKSPTDTIFDLAVDHTQVNNGLVLLKQRKLPLDISANNLAVQVNYAYATQHYLATLQIDDLAAKQGRRPEVHSHLDLNLEMARDAVRLKALHFVSGKSSLEASGALDDFTKLNWQLAANGSIDLRTVAEVAAVPGLGPGQAVLQVKGQGSGANLFDVKGLIKLNDVTYRTPSVLVTGLNAATSVRATPDELLLPDLIVRLRQGGGLDANIRLLHWMAPAPATTVADAQKTTRPLPQAVPKPEQQQATIRARLFSLRLQTLLETVAAKQYANLGFDTQIDGTANVAWTGTIAEMKADTALTLSPPHPAAANEVPVNGNIDATYLNHGGILQAKHIEIHTPYSSAQITGSAGLNPARGPSTLNIAFTTRNLNEFNRALIALNLPSKEKKGTAALPLQLHGQASLHGTLTGSLAAPDLKAHLSATDFSTVIDSSSTPPATKAAKAVPVSVTPPPAPPVSRPPVQQVVQWDDFEADAEYSPARVAISQASLRRGRTSIHVSGQLLAHHLRHGKLAFDNDSALSANATVADASVPELLSIAGQNLPVTGTLNLRAHAGGTLRNLNGGGHLSIARGDIYGEPYKSFDTDLTLAGQDVGLANLLLAQNGGRLTGEGAYNLTTKSFHANAFGNGFELAHIQKLQTPKMSVAGGLTFDLHATGTADKPQVKGHVSLAKLVLDGNPAGGLAADIHTENNVAYLDANSDFAGSQLNIAAQAALTGDYQTRAKLTFSRVDIRPILQIAKVEGVNGSSDLAGTVTLSGPAKTPRLLDGEAEIQQFHLTLQDQPVTSQGPVRATLRKGVVTLQPLHILAPDTNILAEGHADLFGDNAVQAKASGDVNLKIAQSFSPDISSAGKLAFNFQAAGTTKKPELQGRVDFTNVNFAYQAIPNGISHLNGSMVLNQDRLEVQNMTGTTGGGQVLIGGFVAYQQGIYADLKLGLKGTRFRYAGLSTSADANLRLQGTTGSGGLLFSGNVLITRFLVGPNVDFAALGGSSAVSPPPDPTAFANKIRLDVHVTSSPQMDFQNTYAQIAGTVDLHLRGTAAQPSLLGRITVTDGQATFNNTTYQLQHGDIYFTNPVRIEPVIDLDATTRIEEYDVTIGLHGTTSKLAPTFRSEPPLPSADVISLLAQGRTQQEQSMYSSQQAAAGVSGSTDAILSGALNATVSSRIQKLFGVGSVKIDPTYVGSLGSSSARITVGENIGQKVRLTYATNVNTSSQQLIQAQFNLSPTFSVTAVRDEADVFSLLFKVHHRYR